MSIQNFEPTMILAILPEILLIVLAGVILAFDAIWKPEVKRSLGWMTAGGLLLVMVVALLVSRPPADDRLGVGGHEPPGLVGFWIQPVVHVCCSHHSPVWHGFERGGSEG